tara:strand:- start:822 stop:995 length:174 start_codon:yes stop_codon:yes gene_type:complete
MMSKLTFENLKYYVCQLIKIIDAQDQQLREQHKIIFNLNKKGILEADQLLNNENIKH